MAEEMPGLRDKTCEAIVYARVVSVVMKDKCGEQLGHVVEAALSRSGVKKLLTAESDQEGEEVQPQAYPDSHLQQLGQQIS